MSTNSSNSSPGHLIFLACHAAFMGLFISYILLIPLFIFVFYVGYQRFRKQRSVTTTQMMSHSDIFTFNMVALELLSVLGSCFYCYGSYTNYSMMVMLGIYVFSLVSPAQTLFHLLTCADRYLAVVHPITYLGLRQAGRVRIRNMSIVCVWLICILSTSLNTFVQVYFILNATFLLFSMISVSFFSLSVLRGLTHPGPGEAGRKREKIDQSKQRAFQTIVVITVFLFLRFFSQVASIVITFKLTSCPSCQCVLVWSFGWLCLPNSLVLPLLFLHRVGKLSGCIQRPERT